MNDARYFGLDIHQATISAVVLDSTHVRLAQLNFTAEGDD
jgi:hypothetical protein